jgi:outer membrane protein, multidrug efflux system
MAWPWCKLSSSNVNITNVLKVMTIMRKTHVFCSLYRLRQRVGVRVLQAPLALVAAALLTACATAPNPPPAPALPTSVPPTWQAPLPHSGSTTDLTQWWARFNDANLPALIQAAQAVSPNLASAYARVARARAARTASDAAALPMANAVGSAVNGRQTTRGSASTSATAGVQAQWEIDLFGAIAAGRSAAEARLQGAQAGWHNARVSVAAETASAYTALRACEAQAVQSQADSSSRAETARLTDASATAGFTAPAEAALARAGAAQARMQAVAQNAQCDGLIKALVELTDIAETNLRKRLAPGTAVLPKPEPIVTSALPASLLAQRADLADTARAIVAAASDRAQAAAQEKPQISLAGSLGLLAIRANQGFGQTTTSGATWSLGPISVNFPLFDGGARAAATAAAQAGYDEAVALYRAQVRQAVREVETSLVALQSTAQRQGDAELAARDFEASLRATAARQARGLASLFDLEAARRNAVLAQSTLIELQRERVAAWISLYRALGGGWAGELSTAAQ